MGVLCRAWLKSNGISEATTCCLGGARIEIIGWSQGLFFFFFFLSRTVYPPSRQYGVHNYKMNQSTST